LVVEDNRGNVAVYEKRFSNWLFDCFIGKLPSHT